MNTKVGFLRTAASIAILILSAPIARSDGLIPLRNVPPKYAARIAAIRLERAKHLEPRVMRLADAALQAVRGPELEKAKAATEASEFLPDLQKMLTAEGASRRLPETSIIVREAARTGHLNFSDMERAIEEFAQVRPQDGDRLLRGFPFSLPYASAKEHTAPEVSDPFIHGAGPIEIGQTETVADGVKLPPRPMAGHDYGHLRDMNQQGAGLANTFDGQLELEEARIQMSNLIDEIGPLPSLRFSVFHEIPDYAPRFARACSGVSGSVFWRICALGELSSWETSLS